MRLIENFLPVSFVWIDIKLQKSKCFVGILISLKEIALQPLEEEVMFPASAGCGLGIDWTYSTFYSLLQTEFASLLHTGGTLML